VELLLLILRAKRAARRSALKCLDFATTRCPAACDRLVDQQGLKTLFAIFMGKLKVSPLPQHMLAHSFVYIEGEGAGLKAGGCPGGAGGVSRWLRACTATLRCSRRQVQHSGQRSPAPAPASGMRRAPQVKSKDDAAAGEEEERSVSIISSLLQNVAKQASRCLRACGIS
jgi:hypothetical protein